MLFPLRVEAADQYQNTTLVASRKGTGLPHGHGLRAIKLLGKGSNNAVYLYKTRDGQSLVVRKPRHKSDTQRIGNATWEFRNTAVAVQLGVAPLLYDAWYNRHATTEQRGGLHIICEHFPFDLHELIVDKPEKAIALQSELSETIVCQLRAMADNGLFCYDLKPSNMVYSEHPLKVRFIDFGRDFCEWRPYAAANEHIERAPVLSYIQKIAEEKATEHRPASILYSDLAFAAMLIMLSSNVAYTIDTSRAASRCGLREGTSVNFMAPAARELRFATCGKDIKLIKQILRQRDIRDTLRHYLGRRNCGTKRTFAYAGFTCQKRATDLLSRRSVTARKKKKASRRDETGSADQGRNAGAV